MIQLEQLRNISDDTPECTIKDPILNLKFISICDL